MLDADVLIGALDRGDAHHTRARQLFKAWNERGDSILITVINLSEVLVAPGADPERLRSAREAIAALGVRIQSATERIGVEAARLRARYPISLPDAYLLTAAKQTGSTVASFDGEIGRAATAEGIPLASAP